MADFLEIPGPKFGQPWHPVIHWRRLKVDDVIQASFIDSPGNARAIIVTSIDKLGVVMGVNAIKGGDTWYPLQTGSTSSDPAEPKQVQFVFRIYQRPGEDEPWKPTHTSQAP